MSFDGTDLPAPCLGVARSLTGRFWRAPEPEVERKAAALLQQTGLPDLICRVLAHRGVAADEAETYLAPRLRDLMPDPSTLLDMDRAVETLLSAVASRARIAVFADYDVDGGASAALLIDWLRPHGIAATLYVPDRIDEGYGPNVPAMEALARDHDLIICVDCGTLSHAPIAAAKAAGAKVLVLDHHQGGETLPEAEAVVNPNRQDETGDLGFLCAAGVVFMMLVAANRALRSEGRDAPDLMGLLDLVALATVADVAPLVGLNRAFVRQGLAVMGRRGRPGLVALSDTARITSAPSAYHLGYMLGPRVNAGGRIGAADLGAQLLATRDPHEAAALAERLDALNAERRGIEAEVLAQALDQAEARGTDGPLVWAAGEGWHPGVVGIVASRLKEATNRPAIVIGLADGEGKGSGRSVSGVDLGASVAACTREGLLLKGGGHAMAAGLTVAEDQLEAAMDRLSTLLDRQGAAATGPRSLRIDGLVGPGGVTADLIDQMEGAGPFGAGSPAPRVALRDVRIGFAKRAGESHLRLRLNGAGGGIDAIAFRAFESELGPRLEAHGGAPFHIAGRLEIDDWGGRRQPKLRVEDAAEVT
ncbi:MAG: single-stranded-DNA-specific exonuclease RecJ [Pseudomonadota bacterium]